MREQKTSDTMTEVRKKLETLSSRYGTKVFEPAESIKRLLRWA